MKNAIAKLEYLIKSENRSLNEVKKEFIELNAMYSFDSETCTNLEVDQIKVINGYKERIADYKKALEVLKNM